jgi:hypothetical protein
MTLRTDHDDRPDADADAAPDERRDEADVTAPAEAMATPADVTATPTDVTEAPADQPRPSTGRKTVQEQAQARRQEKLDAVAEQLTRGTLVIRQMTDEERLRYPPRPAPAKRPPRR